MSNKTHPHLVLGVTGSIAAYKALELVRLFRKSDWEVQVVMTRNARKFVTAESFAVLSGRPVALELFPKHKTGIPHIDLPMWADLILVAPASANILGKIASGIADDLLSTMLLAVPADILKRGRAILAPGMNVNMWQNPSVQQNIGRLIKMGYAIVGPAQGELACGTSGTGRFLEPRAIFQVCQALLEQTSLGLNGIRVLVTAGRTEEPIDPVRLITNRSSGRMGLAIARAFAAAGASVYLIAGPVSVPLPAGIKTVRVRTTEEMLKQVLARLEQTDILVMCAAVVDFRPTRTAKKKQHQKSLRLELKRTPDILKQVSTTSHRPICIGFSLDPSLTNARTKLLNKKLDLVVANDYSTIDAEYIKPTLIRPKGKPRRLPEMTKELFASKLVAEAAKLLSSKMESEDGRTV
ncbi:bifunctional phosphopantothenoylcysteine decarboxylase/phosphopantothenate--cysteine ligase CoaBC [candidate division WOR-3 bacterium JGI_Cruoil_03_51_56]|uniref:Coenzyme A biosynthesis bifunctional protein CoaBC n=1 Tax=candidate division WOR-3 bacterium JGI_Cruoil_03_51_56 TaxID=1973747 RepID=A0A235BXU1_UNCW3|nr:MAG: bifunctional phosphopantothenoylcysteine decarboxylase/phosphopantothenate--cysteine ligase CoaBC [candidate division WOR-3 bacterium JGI_Cruoil_03_51_56]